MIKLKVKSLWQGKVGIREKYVEEAHRTFQPLLLTYQDQVMLIPREKVQEAIVARSEKPVFDKYKGEEHYLIYYDWKPTSAQIALV